jgi:hypothetical protein
LSASAGFTASLQNGYAWVGNSLGQNTQVPTSSFGGGGTLPSGLLSSSVTNFVDYSASVDTRINNIVVGTGFATTGSNTFTGNQTISGSLLLNGTEVNMTGSSMRFTTTGTGSITFVPGGTLNFFGNTNFTSPIRTTFMNVDNSGSNGYYGFNAETEGRIYQDFSGSVNSRINSIVTGTGFATTGSNTFYGNHTIDTGDLIMGN